MMDDGCKNLLFFNFLWIFPFLFERTLINLKNATEERDKLKRIEFNGFLLSFTVYLKKKNDTQDTKMDEQKNQQFFSMKMNK